MQRPLLPEDKLYASRYCGGQRNQSGLLRNLASTRDEVCFPLSHQRPRQASRQRYPTEYTAHRIRYPARWMGLSTIVPRLDSKSDSQIVVRSLVKLQSILKSRLSGYLTMPGISRRIRNESSWNRPGSIFSPWDEGSVSVSEMVENHAYYLSYLINDCQLIFLISLHIDILAEVMEPGAFLLSASVWKEMAIERLTILFQLTLAPIIVFPTAEWMWHRLDALREKSTRESEVLEDCQMSLGAISVWNIQRREDNLKLTPRSFDEFCNTVKID